MGSLLHSGPEEVGCSSHATTPCMLQWLVSMDLVRRLWCPALVVCVVLSLGLFAFFRVGINISSGFLLSNYKLPLPTHTGSNLEVLLLNERNTGPTWRKKAL